MAANTIGLNQTFPIYNENGTPFHNLVLRKGVVDSVVMSLGDKITGDVYYSDNTLAVTMKEYIEFNGIKYSLVNPPTVVREGVVSDNSELKGMTKYSFEFYHPMYMLANFPFTDVATTVGEEKYLSQNKVFSWIGKPQDFIDKLNKNLQGTVWCVRKSDRFPSDKNNELSDVLTFDNATVAEAIKIGYETWDIPYVVTQIPQTDPLYAQGKRFVVEYGLPSNEIYENDSQRQLDNPFVFRMGKGVGLKNNSRTPRNNKIITRIAGYGSEDNVPYGYPQIVWTGNQDWDYTINNDPNEPLSYPIYKGIVGGQYVKLIKHPFTRTHLMPSIYTDTINKKVNPYATGYDPTIEIKDYYDAVASQQYPYVNEINLQAPSYDSHEFPDIKPEFDSESSIGIISVIPLNSDLTPADHWDDSMDDDGNYLQSYFQITLPQLDFDLYACAAITQEMKINMRSGACIGCTFPIQVDWDDYKANFYDSDGNFLPDGEQRDLTKYPKSNLGQISVVVQKDNTTFGTLMPNIYQQPVANDLFVFIGISLPLSYITDAEERLDDAMKTYMLENNVFYFDYPLKFDEHFLATHTYILEQIRPNSIIRFEYGGVQQQLFVKQLTVKYGNAALPQYDITLTDNIEVVLNQIGQVADDVEKLSSLLSLLRQSYSRNVWNELAKKLSKTQDDTASGYIRMLKGLQVGANFVPDILGEGGVLRMRSDGKVELVTDILYARMKAYFDTVEIREYQHTAGNRIASVAGNKCVRVAWFNSSNVELEQTQANLTSVAYFRCFFRASDGEDTVRNNFKVGDQAYCHITSVDGSSDNPEQKGFNQKHYWRLVVGRNVEGTLTDDNEGWIDLSNRSEVTIGGINYQGYQSGSDVPQAQDDIIQLGNVNDTTRQGAIVEYVTGTDAPSYQIYQGINSFSLNGKNYVRLGYDSQSGGAQAYIGNPNGSSYLWYHLVNGTPKLEIKAKVEITSTESTIDGTPISQYDFYDDTQIWSRIADMQEQIDGVIDTYYYNYMPVAQDSHGAPANRIPLTNVEPYKSWYEADGGGTASEVTTERTKHLSDIFYDNSTGYAFRFSLNENTSQFEWVVITDSAVITALENAAKAQDTADHKRRVFLSQPTVPYDAGDLWVNATYPAGTTVTDETQNKYCNEILRCGTSKTSSQSFDIADWGLAGGSLNKFLNTTYANDKQHLQSQIDGKAETWRQASDPSIPWYDDTQTPVVDVRIHHVGDLWYNTGNNNNFKYQGTYIYENIGTDANPVYGWVEEAIPDEVFDKIDGKSSIYVNDPTAAQNPTPTDYKKRDLWILGGAATINGVAYKSGDVLTSLNDNQTYSASDWIKKVRYTDDDRFEGFITQVLNGTSTTGNDAVVAAALYAIKTALNAGVTTVNGGLILSNIIALRNSNGDIMSGMNGVYNAWAGSSHIIGGGLAAWYGGQMIDYEVLSAFDISEGWDVVHWARSALRFDGSGYFANGNISWDALGNVTIKNITTLYSSQDTDILNQLTTFSNMFHNSTWQEGGATELRIQPQQYFDHLSLKRGSGTVDGDSHYFDITGYSVLNRDEMDARYVRIDFFNRLFQAYSSTTIADANKIAPTDVSTTINNLKIMVGAWTNQYLSAFGINSSGSGGGGGATALSQLSDVELTSLASGNLLQYNGTKWVNIANNFATTAQLSGYLPLSGGTISGALTVTSSALFKNSISFRDISRATGSDYYAGMLLDNRGLYIGFDEGVNNQLNVDGAGRFNSLYIGSAAVATQSWVNSLGYIAPTLSGLANGDILVYDSVGTWLNVPLSGFGFATQSWVGQQGYLTSSALAGYIHPTLTNLANGDILVYDSVGAWVNVTKSSFLSGYATQSWVNTQLGNYLPLSGGTLTGVLTIAPTNTGAQQLGLRLHDNGGGGSEGLWIQWTSASYLDGVKLLGRPDVQDLQFINSSGTWYTVWHSGNLTNNNQLTNGAGYITSTALNGYIHPTLTNLANGDVLVYDSVGAWVNVSKTNFLAGFATTAQLSGYLPLSGGTISGVSESPLSISTSTVYSAITFINANGYRLFGIRSDGNLFTTPFNNWSDEYRIYHTGNLTNISQLINDSGYITSSGSCAYATSAGSASYANGISISANSGDILINDGGASWVTTNLNGAISSFGYITSAGSCNYATSAGNADTLDGYHSSYFLPKLTYEYNFESNFGSTGLLLIGKFRCYDSNVTIYIDSTTGQSMHATLVLATQNINSYGGGTIQFKSFGDYDNSITPRVYLYYPSNSPWIEIYYVPSSWSKNVIHIKACGVSDVSDVNTAISSLPEHTYIQPTNAVKLPAARTIWGQSFDGTGNVDGAFYAHGEHGGYAVYAGMDNGESARFEALTASGGWNAQGFTLMQNGNIGIGTHSPSYKLDVNGSANATTLYENGTALSSKYIGKVSANSGDIWINDGGSSWVTTNLNSTISGFGYITSSGSCNYANSAGSVAWSNVSGRPTNVSSFTNDSGYITSSGSCNYATSSGTTNGINISANSGDILICDGGRSWVTIPSSYISDIRKKDVLNYNAEPTFEAVANAPAIRFTYKDARYSFNQGVKVGSIAQYWKTELPEAVNEDNEGYLSMQYEVLGLLAAIAVAKRVTNHERRIESLERENALLRLELNKIKAA